MPSKSARQARTMRAAAHDPAFAKKLDIPQSVAQDYVAADKRAGNPFAKAANRMAIAAARKKK